MENAVFTGWTKAVNPLFVEMGELRQYYNSCSALENAVLHKR